MQEAKDQSFDQIIIKTVKSLIPFYFIAYVLSYLYIYLYWFKIGASGLISTYSALDILMKPFWFYLLAAIIVARMIFKEIKKNEKKPIILEAIILTFAFLSSIYLYTKTTNANAKFFIASIIFIIYLYPILRYIAYSLILKDRKNTSREVKEFYFIEIITSIFVATFIYSKFTADIDLSTAFQRKPIAHDLNHTELRVIDTTETHIIVFYPSTQKIKLIKPTEIKYSLRLDGKNSNEK